jgi:hypothetical protein
MSPGFIDPNGKPLGTDFMDVWAAGKLALSGNPAGAYDYAVHFDVQRHALPYPAGAEAGYYGWHYPPMFLFAAVPLALLSYGAALAVWMALTLPVYIAVIKGIVPYRHIMLVTLAYPAVFVNLGHGQNGFLTTGLMGGGLLLLESRPVLAGVLFGLLSYKPQFGILLPIALIAGSQWRAFFSAGVTVMIVALASAAVFGFDTWQAFFDSLPLTRGYILEQGATGWEKIQSIFSAVRMLGGGIEAAYAAQTAMLVIVAAVVIFVWRQPVRIGLKGAALAVGSVMATPYVLDYDLIIVALSIAWLAAEGRAHGFLSWEKTVCLAAFVLPLVSRSIGMAGIPIAPVVLALLLAAILRRVCVQTDLASTRLSSPVGGQSL